MGKHKKGRKKAGDSDSDEAPAMTIEDDAAEELADEPATKAPPKKGKKAKKAKKKAAMESDDDEDQIGDDDDDLPAPPKAKMSGFAALMMDESDDEAPAPPPKKPGFASLMDDSGDDKPESEDEVVVVKKKDKKKEKKGKEKKKKKKDEGLDDDLEKMLSELQLEYTGEQTSTGIGESEPPKPAEKEPSVEKTAEPAAAGDAEDKDEGDEDDGEEEGGTVKTKAQKRKEKKERERLKKIEQNKKTGKKQEKEDEKEKEKETPAEKPAETNGEKASKPPPAKEEKPPAEDGEEKESAASKKKKKKKAAEKAPEPEPEETTKKKKGPGKKIVAAMQEALRLQQEAEERAKREEEERIRREEEAERLKAEREAQEREQKELKKRQAKERKEQLKAEGKLLTPKQKQNMARAQALLDAMKQQAAVVAEKKKPSMKDMRKKGKQQSPDAETKPEPKPEPPKSEVKEEPKEEAKPADEPKESWEDEDDVKDSWDQEDDEEEKAAPKSAPEAAPETPAKTDAKAAPAEEEEEESSDEEDEDESGSEEESESEEDSDDERTEAEKRRDRALKRIQQRRDEARAAMSADNLRAPVICVLGHVDTGKTKILDKLRRTNVQEGEAGGITQQIGATNVPLKAIEEQQKFVKKHKVAELKIPGLLIIDTPGHESFSNLRSRGSSLCDLAILVVDIMHGLEPQTIESINMLKTKKTPFVVALNKIDRLYDWETGRGKDVEDICKSQARNTVLEFEQRTNETIVQLAEQGLNAKLFYENDNPREYLSLVPTSAITGEGMGNLMALVVMMTQNMLTKRLMYSDELQATVLEVKQIPGLGTTIDVILVNGTLREGSTIVVAGTDGPIVTQIRSLLMPQPLKELRVKNAYQEFKEIRAAQGVKIAAKELEKAIAGLNLMVAEHPDEIEICKALVAKELRSALSAIKLSDHGVYVQASTLGSLEALLEFLRTSKIPYSGVRIGPVVKRDVMKASVMLDRDPEFAVILAFDVKVERDAQEMADSAGVTIFQADIIYHLFDKFMKHREDLKNKKREEHKHIAVFPCKIRVLPQFIFNSRDPIVMGVSVEAGIVKTGTPICVPSKEFLFLGYISTVEINHKQVEVARKGQEVCIKIEAVPGESPKMFGRHFDETDMLVSRISRESIDACKNYFREDLTKPDWQLMIELKKVFQII
ncbi:eukaryotic translation initiation factor 5B-like [Amphibalanus amphitrite]|uniref:eukaryotic translation initiation factor 5B-like n=1 Tax=Amphibalanus amphitrite TaxID=1232801 RepID=UPI001C90F154|nr:eukaryotic translation initiation factor 5B-like [Amphibalanus amphitrite]